MYKKAKILFFCMIFVAGGVFAQKYTAKEVSITDIYTTKWNYQDGNKITFQNYFRQVKDEMKRKRHADTKPVVYVRIMPHSIIAADFYTCNFGFFCKKELQFEKATKIPLKFRLGSLQYNDYLEAKPNAGILSSH